MTGRELIIYILENGLEDEPIFKDGKFIGLMSVEDAAVKFDVGTHTILAWFAMDYLKGIRVGDTVYILSNAELTIPK